MTVTTNGTGEAATISTAAAQARLEQMAQEVQGQLDDAKAQRDVILQTLKEHDQLVERLSIAAKALAGPAPRAKADAPWKPKPTSRETTQLVEATMARHGEPVSVSQLAELVGKHESLVRSVLYHSRDEGRVRVTGVTGPRSAKAYALMPEVVAEYA